MKKIQALETSNLIPLRRSNPLINKGYHTVIADWLGRFSSVHTVRVYRHSINEFFCFISEQDEFVSEEDEIEVLTEFLLLEEKQAYELVAQYQRCLVEQKLAPGTINRKLAAIKSLVNYASLIGKCCYTLNNIKTITVTIYRDTTGISTESFKEILDTVDRSTIKGKRDYAILLLLWGNALRRSEVTSCKIKHFEPREQRLWILGKGKKGQLQTVSLGEETVKAIQIWLEERKNFELRIQNSEQGIQNSKEINSNSTQKLSVTSNQKELKTNNNKVANSMNGDSSLGQHSLDEETSSGSDRNLKVNSSVLRSAESTGKLPQFTVLSSPLFCAVHKGYWGHQLNTDSIYKLVKKYANLAGIEKTLSPHRLRHSAITAALEATNGDVRSVQKLSRHSSLNTLMIYDDNRRNEQGRVTKILESLL